MLKIGFFLGCQSSCIFNPICLVGKSLWLSRRWFNNVIGWAGLIFAVYAFKFIWSPIIDNLRIPWLKNLGHRKSWILISQLMIILLCFICWIQLKHANLTLVISIGLNIIASALKTLSLMHYRMML